MSKVIHKPHPTADYIHPFKYWTLCNISSRFGSLEMPDRKVSCKKCINIMKKLCPTCLGTGVKNTHEES